MRHEDYSTKGSAVQTMVLKAIGHVETELDTPSEPPGENVLESRLVLDSSIVAGLQGLEGGQRILVIFWMHRSSGYTLLQHPRGDRSRPKRGVFALRTPHRPNPIGVTEVEIVAIEGNVVRVRGLDAVSGTPIIDLKPA